MYSVHQILLSILLISLILLQQSTLYRWICQYYCGTSGMIRMHVVLVQSSQGPEYDDGKDSRRGFDAYCPSAFPGPGLEQCEPDSFSQR